MSQPLPPPRSASIVVPVSQAEQELPRLLDAVFAQKPNPPAEVILVDSKGHPSTAAAAARFERVRLVPIERFSHGRARNLGARNATGELVVLMTQDAIPLDEHWLAKLVAPFYDPAVAAAYSRQTPRPDANPMERFFLEDRFPPNPPMRRTKRGDEPLSLEKVFFSNVSSAVRRELLLRFPFDETLIMSEDQQLSRDLLLAGYAVVYQPDSVVVHSHNYSLPVVFRRYFDSVYSLRLIFAGHDLGESTSIGARYLAREAGHMLLRHPLWLPYYCLYTAAKIAGTLAAHAADHMPRALKRWLSLHRYHWDGEQRGGQ